MSKFNSEPIDIVIPWVNPNDPVWRKDFEYWKQKETGNKDTCRYRDWGFIKYVFRSIEENCPWCRYVFLVLSGPSQIPDWLNVNHPKLKIVYHKDYIPEEFLPTFNSNIIELFYSRIEELSENFILCNDDTFFCQNKPEDFFFKNDLPVMLNNTRFGGHTAWEKTVNNSKDMANKILGYNGRSIYYNQHLPVCYKKSLQQFVMPKIDLSKMRQSKFRKPSDIMHLLYLDFQGRSKYKIFNNAYRGQFYCISAAPRNLNFNQPMICVNEGELSTDKSIKNYCAQIEKRFSKKSGFEQ